MKNAKTMAHESWRGSDDEISKAMDISKMCSAMAAKQKQTAAKNTILEYKIDTGCNGNLMPIKKFKVLFLKITMIKLTNYENKKGGPVLPGMPDVKTLQLLSVNCIPIQS